MQKTYTLLLLLILFTSNSIAGQRVFIAHDRMLYVSILKPSQLVIDTSWSYGNEGAHPVSSTLHQTTKVLYASHSKYGKDTPVTVQGIHYQILEPGMYVFRISLQAKGGHPYLHNPYMKVVVND